MSRFNHWKTTEKKFVASNRVYFGELPPHLAQVGVPQSVARDGMFYLTKREGNQLTFYIHHLGSRDNKITLTAKVLTNPTTGEEVCFVNYEGTRILLQASTYMVRGRRVTQEEMEKMFVADGRTVAQFLKDKAEELKAKKNR